MGTTLAVVGAYVLASKIRSRTVIGDALADYERTMRPWVEQVQKLPPGVPPIANPTSRAGVAVLQAVMRIGGTPVARGAVSRLGTCASSGGNFSIPENTHGSSR